VHLALLSKLARRSEGERGCSARGCLAIGGFFDPVRMVVIAKDQVFLPVEQFEIGVMVVEGEIAQLINQVLRCIHCSFGWAVGPAISTRRLSRWIKNST
jgi:hypothetical protein